MYVNATALRRQRFCDNQLFIKKKFFRKIVSILSVNVLLRPFQLLSEFLNTQEPEGGELKVTLTPKNVLKG